MKKWIVRVDFAQTIKWKVERGRTRRKKSSSASERWVLKRGKWKFCDEPIICSDCLSLVADALPVFWHRPLRKDVILRTPQCSEGRRWESSWGNDVVCVPDKRLLVRKKTGCFNAYLSVFLLSPLKECTWTTSFCSSSAWGSPTPTTTSTLTTTSPALSVWRTCSVRNSGVACENLADNLTVEEVCEVKLYVSARSLPGSGWIQEGTCQNQHGTGRIRLNSFFCVYFQLHVLTVVAMWFVTVYLPTWQFVLMAMSV